MAVADAQREWADKKEANRQNLISCLRLRRLLRREDLTQDEMKKKSEYYVPIKTAYGEPALLNKIATCVWDLLPENTNCVAGKGYGGVILTSALCSRYGLKQIAVSDKPDRHTNSIFLGHEPRAGDRVAIVNDTTDSGNSFRELVDVIKSSGAEVLCCVAVQRRGLTEVNLGMPVLHVLTPRELL